MTIGLIHVYCWKWGDKYDFSYAAKLRAMVGRHLTHEHVFACITDDPLACWKAGVPGAKMPEAAEQLLSMDDGCYARLVMFSPTWQETMSVGPTDRIVCLDLDLVATGELDGPFTMPGPFRILHGGHFNPCPFNGSVMAIDAGSCPEVWHDFKADVAHYVARNGLHRYGGSYRGTDQTWIAHKLPGALGWTWRDGIYAYGKPGWPGRLPDDARIVAFPGSADPSQLSHLPWIQEHWRER